MNIKFSWKSATNVYTPTLSDRQISVNTEKGNNKKMEPLLILALLILVQVLGHHTNESTSIHQLCKPTVTEVSGTFAPRNYCSGDLIFEDNFDDLNMEKWQHENTLAGGGNWEFQWYNNNRTNSFTKDGILFIRPSLLAHQFGEKYLTSGILNVNGGAPADECTQPQFYGCERTGTPSHVLNPIKSARIRTVHSFSFQYGKVEVRAKTPSGDWLWPAIWMMPAFNKYGTWPSSGEIDILESRGNKRLTENGINIGTQQVGSTLQFGPYPELNKWNLARWIRNNDKGFDTEFHRYQMEWTPDNIKFSIDDIELGSIIPPKGGFWEHGNFSSYNIDNPWTTGSKMAPFDQKFYIIINLACGGTTGFFSDNASNPNGKPWSNSSPRALTDFWNAKNDWLPTWHLEQNQGHDASLQVDYLRVWAV